MDALLLHAPSTAGGGTLGAADWAVWRAMEALHAAGRVRSLGVSNVNEAQLRELFAGAAVPPTWVQNRCYAVTGWDAVRVCVRVCACVYAWERRT